MVIGLHTPSCCKLVDRNTFGSMLHKSNHFTYVIVVSVADLRIYSNPVFAG